MSGGGPAVGVVLPGGAGTVPREKALADSGLSGRLALLLGRARVPEVGGAARQELGGRGAQVLDDVGEVDGAQVAAHWVTASVRSRAAYSAIVPSTGGSACSTSGPTRALWS